MARPIRTEVAVDTTGIAEVAKLGQARSATLKAVKAGAKLIQGAAKARAPKRKGSGALRQSLGIKSVKGSKGRTLSFAVIGPRKKVAKMVPVGRGGRKVRAVPAYYAHLVEGGTKPHRLSKGAKVARRGKAASGQDAGALHPGAKPQPFLGPAFDATKDRAKEEAQRVLAGEVDKIVQKAAAKAFKAMGKR